MIIQNNRLISDFDETLFARINDRLSYDENKFKTEEANFKEGICSMTKKFMVNFSKSKAILSLSTLSTMIPLQ